MQKIPFSATANPTIVDKSKTSAFVPERIPEFIRTEFPTFVEFIKTYYQFSDQRIDGVSGGIASIKDLDKIGEKYLAQFYANYAKDLPVFPYMGMADFLRNAKEFYVSRGSEDSYRFLFRIMFGEEISLHYPSNDILRSSTGQWIQRNSIYVDVIDGDITTLVGEKIIIKNNDGTTTSLQIQEVNLYDGTLYEVFVNKTTGRNIRVGDSVIGDYDSVSGQYLLRGSIAQTINKYKILDSGEGFTLGQSIEFLSVEGESFTARITDLTPTNGISKLEFLSFPGEASTGFVRNVNQDGTSDDVFEADRLNITGDGSLVTKPNYFDSPMPDSSWFAVPDYAADVLGDSENIFNHKPIPRKAKIQFILGTLNRYSGSYENQKGFLSNSNRLHDNFFFQAFSYVIRSQVQLSVYNDLVRRVLHPAGTIMFGEYDLSEQFDIEITTEEEPIEKNTILVDFTGSSDQRNIVVQYFREFEETVQQLDSSNWHLERPITDSVSVIEDGELYYWAEGDYAIDYFEDLIYSTSNSIVVDFNEQLFESALIDNAATSDSGSLVMIKGNDYSSQSYFEDPQYATAGIVSLSI